MNFAKEANKFVAYHHKALFRALVLLVILWFVSGIILVDVIDPYLFIGLWLPFGAVTAWFAYKW